MYTINLKTYILEQYKPPISTIYETRIEPRTIIVDTWEESRARGSIVGKGTMLQAGRS
jgi:hypothetical protein